MNESYGALNNNHISNKISSSVNLVLENELLHKTLFT